MQAFHPDSKFMAAFNLFADIVIVNMLLVVTSLPVVTGGAALRSANVVIGDMVQGKGSRYGLAFIRQLTAQWKASTLYWLGLVAAGLLLVYQQFVVFQAGVSGVALTIIQGLALAGAFIIAGISVWFFALASLQQGETKEDNAGRAMTRISATAVQCTFRYLGYTVAAVAVLVAAVIAVVKLPVAVSIPLVFFLLPAVSIYLIRLILALPLGQELGE